MGTQINVETSNLLKAGARVEFTSTLANDGDNNDDYYFTQAKITMPDGEVFYMSYVSIDNINLLCNDYNAWGSNVRKIEPIITKYNIPHILG